MRYKKNWARKALSFGYLESPFQEMGLVLIIFDSQTLFLILGGCEVV